MDWQAAIPFVSAGAVGGAVVWALCALLPSGCGAARWPLTITAAVVLGLVGPRLIPAFAPSLAEVERQLLEGDDLSAAWKEADPQTFSAFVADIRSAYSGDDRSAALARARAGVADAARRRLSNLDDESIVEYLRVQRDIFLDLRTEGPEFCRPIYFAEPLSSDDLPVNMNLARRQQRIFANAFRASTAPKPTLTGADYDVALEAVLQTTEHAIGEDMALLSQDTPVIGREVQFCAAAAEMLNQFSASTQAGPLYRGMLTRTAE